jgi:hypothetical protein
VKYPDVKKAVEAPIALWDRDDIGSADWQEAARSAADAAAWAAVYDRYADKVLSLVKECR